MVELPRDFTQDDANFAGNVRRKREHFGWSQGDLAKRLQKAGLPKFHQTTVSRVEKLERPVRIGETRVFCDVLQTPLPRMLQAPKNAELIDALIGVVGDMSRAREELKDATHRFLIERLAAQAGLNEDGPQVPESLGHDEVARVRGLLDALREAAEVGPHDVVAEAEQEFYAPSKFSISGVGDDGVDQEEG